MDYPKPVKIQPDWQASKPAQGVLVVGGVLFDLAEKFGVLARIFFRMTPQKFSGPVLSRPPDSIKFVISHHRACCAGFAHRASNSQNLLLPGTAIYKITNKDHSPLWMPEDTFDLGVVEFVQQSMQSAGMTMNVTNEIVSLDSHAESFYSKSARREMNSNRSVCSPIVRLSIS
jgi:hypothetical protein